MKLIEFCGAPGCGKSTLCHILELNLKEQGYTVGNLHLPKEKKAKTLFQRIKKFGNLYLFPIVYCLAPCNRDLRKNLKQLPVTDTRRYGAREYYSLIIY